MNIPSLTSYLNKKDVTSRQRFYSSSRKGAFFATLICSILLVARFLVSDDETRLFLIVMISVLVFYIIVASLIVFIIGPTYENNISRTYMKDIEVHDAEKK